MWLTVTLHVPSEARRRILRGPCRAYTTSASAARLGVRMDRPGALINGYAALAGKKTLTPEIMAQWHVVRAGRDVEPCSPVGETIWRRRPRKPLVIRSTSRPAFDHMDFDRIDIIPPLTSPGCRCSTALATRHGAARMTRSRLQSKPSERSRALPPSSPRIGGGAREIERDARKSALVG